MTSESLFLLMAALRSRLPLLFRDGPIRRRETWTGPLLSVLLAGSLGLRVQRSLA